MNFDQLVALIETNLTRVGSNRISGPEIKEVALAIVNYFATKVSTIIPDWTAGKVFQLDGTDDGRYCKHADDNGKSRFFETKINDNTGAGNEPPTDPDTTENSSWREVSASSGSAIHEYAPGLFLAGLQIVFHNHSVDGPGIYYLVEADRPFNSTNIETEIASGKWEKIGGSGKGIAKTYATIAALLADQALQKTDFFYFVTDASADATVDTGWALYQKLSASTGAIGDYRKLSEAESLDLVFTVPDWDDTTAGKVERAIQAEAETAADTTLGNRNNTHGFTARSFRWAFDSVWTWVKTQTQTFAAQITFTSAPRFSSTTASQTLEVDGNKDLISVAKNSAYNKNFASDAETITGTEAAKPTAPSNITAWWTNIKTVAQTIAGVWQAPTPALGTNTTQIATMAALQAALGVGVVDLGDVSGAVSVDLSTGRKFKCRATGNITSFTFTNEVVGLDYYLDITTETAAKTIAWTAAKFRWPLGTNGIPQLTNCTLNGTSGPARAIDKFIFTCAVAGRLDVSIMPDLQNN